jgi:hypothetical protein
MTTEATTDSGSVLPPGSSAAGAVGAPVTPSFPAGWYAVDNRVNTKRYWDGEKWTGDFAPIDSAAVPGQRESTSGRGLTAVSFVLAAVSLGFFPIVLGPVAIVCAGVAMNRKERNAPVALAVAVVAMIVGMFLGALVWAHNNS